MIPLAINGRSDVYCQVSAVFIEVYQLFIDGSSRQIHRSTHTRRMQWTRAASIFMNVKMNLLPAVPLATEQYTSCEKWYSNACTWANNGGTHVTFWRAVATCW